MQTFNVFSNLIITKNVVFLNRINVIIADNFNPSVKYAKETIMKFDNI